MRVDVLVLDDVFDLGLSAVLDAFQTANELIGMAKLAVPRFEVRTVGAMIIRSTVWIVIAASTCRILKCFERSTPGSAS